MLNPIERADKIESDIEFVCTLFQVPSEILRFTKKLLPKTAEGYMLKRGLISNHSIMLTVCDLNYQTRGSARISLRRRMQDFDAIRGTYPKRMSGRYGDSQAYPTESSCTTFQHLRKGRLYKIRKALVNAQSNLVHGESVWLENETRRIANVR